MRNNRKAEDRDRQKLPFVSVIVPVYNAESTVSTTIEALLRQDYPSEKMEIVVVDDGSTDRSREAISRYPVKLVCHDQNKGDSASRNTGAENAIGEILMTTDADDRVDESWISNLVAGYGDSDVGAVVGSSHLEYDAGNWQQRILAEIWVCLRSGERVTEVHDRYRRMSRTGRSVGTNQSFRKSVFEALKGFDTNLTAGMELDILWRVEKAGYRIAFQPDAIVYTHPKSNIGDFLKQAFNRASGVVALYLKYPSMLKSTFLFNAGFVPALIVLLAIGFALDMALLLYISLVLIIAPLVFYIIQLIRARQYIQNPKDRLLVLGVRYAAFMAGVLGIFRGVWGRIMPRRKRY